MKNKIAICAVMALLFAPTVSNARWGMDFTANNWKMDAKDLKTDKQSHENLRSLGWTMHTELSQSSLGGEARFFKEGNSPLSLGFAVGFGGMPDMNSNSGGSFGGSNAQQGLSSRAFYIPVDLYLKHTSKGGNFSVFGGAGADYVRASTYYDASGSGGYWEKATFTQTKTVPHARAGCEFFLAKWISLDVGVKYVFSAIFDNLTGNLTGSAGVVPGKSRMIMKKFSYGETMDSKLTSATLGTGERPFKYDFSGLRATFGLKMYFN
ncbi:MAG: hypothetical protein Q7J73_02645 [Dehalococcoidales bacterium]|nr:hypothetical protein [Dehalococcoidales bacterium]